jgi:hypothetical protein
LLPGLSEAETLATLIHETAHELLRKAERRTMTTPAVRETEAEAVAYVVGAALGLDFGSASADYIALWHGNAALLAESLAVIQRTSALILGRLKPKRRRPQPRPRRRWPDADRGAFRSSIRPEPARAAFMVRLRAREGSRGPRLSPSVGIC